MFRDTQKENRLRAYPKEVLVRYIACIPTLQGIQWNFINSIRDVVLAQEYEDLWLEYHALRRRLTPALMRRAERNRPTRADREIVRKIGRVRKRIKTLEEILKPKAAAYRKKKKKRKR